MTLSPDPGYTLSLNPGHILNPEPGYILSLTLLSDPLEVAGDLGLLTGPGVGLIGLSK